MNMRPHVVSCRLSQREWREFNAICQRSKVTMYDMMRALIKDAIAEESENVRRIEPEGREDSGEVGEGCGAAA